MIPGEGMSPMPTESNTPASVHAEAHTPRVLTITFVGTQPGDVIEGTFQSSGGPGQLPQSGTWRVQRKVRP